ncbi:MAG: thioredoxin domain-containing protein [Candidatus Bilamarchaeaceae archaeon]
MKKLILFAFIVGIAFLVLGCLQQDGEKQTQNQNSVQAPKVVVFYDPANDGLEKLIMEKTKNHLPSVAFDFKCVDFTKIMYGQASQSEQKCLMEDQSYQQNMDLFNNLLQKNMTAVIYVNKEGNYLPVQVAIHPLTLAKNICSSYNYTECIYLPQNKQLKVKVYAKNANDIQFYSQLFSVLSNSGLNLDQELKIADEDGVQSLKKSTNAKFLPIMLIENGAEDDNLVLDMYTDYIMQSSSLFEAKKIDDGYVFYPRGGTAEYYIGDEPLIGASAYVPQGETSAYMGIFDGLSFVGVYLNTTYKELNKSAANDLGKKTNISYLPILVIEPDNLTDNQKKILESLIAQPLQIQSGLVLYVKQIDGVYYAYTSLSSPELYIGKKLEKVTLDLYVMSHCPFGIQMQKAFVPVVEAFKDSGRLQVNNKFVYYTMHGDEETNDNLYEYCVGAKVPAKEWDFIKCFIENNGDENKCMQNLGIDKNLIDQCVSESKAKYKISGTSFPIYAEENQKYGVQGSPTVVFMGKQVQLNRSPEAIKEFVCSMLEEPLPAACSANLSNNIVAYGFGPIDSTSSPSSAGSVGSCG